MAATGIPREHKDDADATLADISHLVALSNLDGSNVNLPVSELPTTTATGDAAIIVANVTDRNALTNAPGPDQLKVGRLVYVEDDGAGTPETYIVKTPAATWLTSDVAPTGADNPDTPDIKLTAADEAGAIALQDALTNAAGADQLVDDVNVSLFVTGSLTAFRVTKIHGAAATFALSTKTQIYPAITVAGGVMTVSAAGPTPIGLDIVRVELMTGVNAVLVELPASAPDEHEIYLWRTGTNDGDFDPNGADTIEGVTAAPKGGTIARDRTGVRLVKQGNNWLVYELGVQTPITTTTTATDFIV